MTGTDPPPAATRRAASPAPPPTLVPSSHSALGVGGGTALAASSDPNPRHRHAGGGSGGGIEGSADEDGGDGAAGAKGSRIVVSPSQHFVLETALARWQGSGLLDAATADRLAATLKMQTFDWVRGVRYVTWAAMACFVISFFALLAEDWIIELVNWVLTFFSGLISPLTGGGIACGLLAMLLYKWGTSRRRTAFAASRDAAAAVATAVAATRAAAEAKLSYAITARSSYRTNAIFAFAAMALGASISFFVAGPLNWLEWPDVFIGAALLYAFIAVATESSLTWVLALCLTSVWWCDTRTGYLTGMYFVGVGAPLRALGLGALLTAASGVPARMSPAAALARRLAKFAHSTHVMGLLHILASLHILSIVGDVGRDAYDIASRFEFACWALLSGIVCMAVCLHGLKRDDGTSRGFGVVFLLLNLYTRFYERFWLLLPKSLFFAVLGASFWLLASKGEQVLGSTLRAMLLAPGRSMWTAYSGGPGAARRAVQTS